MDLIACMSWPLRSMTRDSLDDYTINLFYLLRLTRLGKIFILMNMQIFTRYMRNFFRKKLIN